jgi:hypothetical protein
MLALSMHRSTALLRIRDDATNYLVAARLSEERLATISGAALPRANS